MVDFAGWEMPVQFKSIVEEHKATRAAAGLFDVSHMGPCFLFLKDGMGEDGGHEKIAAAIERIVTRAAVDRVVAGTTVDRVGVHITGQIITETGTREVLDTVVGVAGSVAGVRNTEGSGPCFSITLPLTNE